MTPRKSIHQEIWDTLPWYVNGTLGSAELDAVTNHLPTCEACREEVARCRGLAMAVRTAADPDWVPSPERLTRLLGRIDEIEAAGAASLGRGRLRRWLAGVRETLWTTPVSIRWALAAQGALVVLLAALVT